MTRSLAILAPGLTGPAGHELEYTNAVATAALDQGLAVRVVAPKLAAALPLPVQVERRLVQPVGVRPGPSWSARVGRLVDAASAQLDEIGLRKLFATARETTWLLHTAPYDQIGRILRAFVSSRGGSTASRLAIVLRYDHYDDPAAIAQIRNALALADRPEVMLFSDSDDLRVRLAAAAPCPIGLIPIPLEPGQVVERDRTAGFFGAMRRQKGFLQLPALFALAGALQPDLRFYVQAYAHPSDSGDPELLHACEALRSDPRVTLETGTLDSAAFRARVAACAAVVTPYDPSVYRAGTSGVFGLALAGGGAVLGPPEGWMANEARRAGLTRFVPADAADVEDAAKKLVGAVELGTKPFEPTQAERRWISFNSPAALVRKIMA